MGIAQVGAKLRERTLRDVEAQLPLDLHEGEPQPAPQPDPPPLPPQGLHRRGGVALGPGRAVRQTEAFARAANLFQSARNFSSPRSASGCSNSFFRKSAGSVATTAPLMAASTTCR